MSYTHPFKLHSPTVQKGVKLNAKKYWKVLRVPHTHKKASKNDDICFLLFIHIFYMENTTMFCGDIDGKVVRDFLGNISFISLPLKVTYCNFYSKKCFFSISI